MTALSTGRPEHAWFAEARLGLFVHWGLYALAGRHEWVMSNEQIHPDRYERYQRYFEADRYDPRAWARAAKAAGMRYAVLTTKHHDGFCLWDSALTDYTSVHTPFGRDAVAEFVEAFRAEGLKVGFYHSLLDWHHPDFPVDVHHPLRDDPAAPGLNEQRSLERYRTYLHGQVRELLTGYGTVDYLFFDFSYSKDAYRGMPGKGAADWGSEELLAMVRELQPGIVVNDRLEVPGDLVTPEQYQPSGPMLGPGGEPLAWEACQTLNGSWGYDRDNSDYKSVPLLVRMLVDGVSNGGNLLLNVGPTGRGDLDPRALASLEGLAAWMDRHGRSVHGAGPSELVPPPDCRYTVRGDRLYVHVFSWPLGHLHLPGLAGKVAYAQLLDDASEVAITEIEPGQSAQTTVPGGQPPGTLTLRLPTSPPPVAVPVVELFLR
ncbi:alpha-L-fucosidase [Microlunatus lacustris]